MQRKKVADPAPQRRVVVCLQTHEQVPFIQLSAAKGRQSIHPFFQATGQVNMADAIHDGLRQGRHEKGGSVHIFGSQNIVRKFQGVIFIGHPVDDERAESLVGMQVNCIELLGLQGIVLQGAMISDTSSADTRTASSKFIDDPSFSFHGAKYKKLHNN